MIYAERKLFPLCASSDIQCASFFSRFPTRKHYPAEPREGLLLFNIKKGEALSLSFSLCLCLPTRSKVDKERCAAAATRETHIYVIFLFSRIFAGTIIILSLAARLFLLPFFSSSSILSAALLSLSLSLQANNVNYVRAPRRIHGLVTLMAES